MSLAEQIAREHLALLNTSTWLIVGCTCDPTLTAPPSGAAGSWYAAHIATVAERAVQERIATLIEAQRFGDDARHPSHVEFDDALTFAASIARGGTR